MGKLAQTLLRSTDLSMAYIPCCAFVLMKHNGLLYKSRPTIYKYINGKVAMTVEDAIKVSRHFDAAIYVPELDVIK